MMSCEREFLEIIPKSEVTTDLLFKTNKDFDVAINGAYREFHEYYDIAWEFGDLVGDDALHLAQRSNERVNLDNFFTDVNATIVADAWRYNYKVIARVNTILSRLKDADASLIVDKDQYAGEARFLRALAYFNLVRIFGDIPKITEPLSIGESFKMKRVAADAIYDEIIIPDLIESETALPATYSAANVGSATKGAAKSLLGTVYLTRQEFGLAEAKLKEVTTMGYALLNNYEDLFDFDNEHHSEFIFDIEYVDGNIGLGSVYQMRFNVEDQDVGANLVNALREVFHFKGRRGGEGTGSPSAEFIALFEPNDIRKTRTASQGIYNLQGNFVSPNPGLLVTSLTLKYHQDGYNFDYTDGKANWRVIRYADVLLMLAEALNENGKTAEAITYLNQIRTRAGLSGYTGLNQADTREKIYIERRLELYMEGHRWFDLLRTGRALNTMASYGMKPHMTVFPIPQSQIEVINDPEILWQNPGY